MLRPGDFAVTLGLLIAVPMQAAISRADLLDMAAKHVDPKVILALIQRDCVDFDITPAIAVELSKTLSPNILDTAITCRQHSANPAQPSAGGVAANAPPSPARAAPASPTAQTWETFYPKPGQSLCFEAGASKNEAFAALQANGFQTAGEHASFWCKPGKPSEEICEIRVEDPAWLYVRPGVPPDDEHFAFYFNDNHLVGTLYMLEFVDRDRATAVYRDARGAMTEAFHKQAQPVGFWRRHLLKIYMRLFNGSAEDAATWENEHYLAVVMFAGRSVGPSMMNPVVLISMSSKQGSD